MKKVLVLAYDFPPLISIGGQRPYSWYKYFPLFGYQVTVVSRQWSESINSPEDYVKPLGNNTIITADEKGTQTLLFVPYKPNLRDKLLLKYGYNRFALVRKLLTFFYAFAEHLFLKFDAKAEIYRQADAFLAGNKVDYIIATGEPFIMFKYGSRLAARYNIPWVADYRDGWTTNQGNYNPGVLQRLQIAFYRLREQLYISNAALVTTPAPEYASVLKELHPGKKVGVVYNGYDEDAFTGLENVQPTSDKFVISYAGIIYPHQNLEMFLDGLDVFLSKGDVDVSKVEVNFYGLTSQPDSVARVKKKISVADVINFTPKLPYTEIVKKLKASHVQLLLTAKGANWLNAKVFDYLGTGQPIMLVENDHSVLEKMVKIGKGAAMNSANEVAEYLWQQHEQWKSGIAITGPVSEAAKEYTRSQQAKNFCALLDLQLKAEK